MKFELTDYVAPEKAPHAYRPHIEALIEAGEGKVLRATGTEEELKVEVRQFQEAAKELNRSARRRTYVDNGDGTFTMEIGVRPPIVRKPKSETPEAQTAADAEPAPVTAKAAKA